MLDKKQYLICGVGVTDSPALDFLRSADLVISRGEIASHWLSENSIENIQKFMLDPGQTLAQWWDTINFDQKTKIAYVSSITPIMVDRVAQHLFSVVEQNQIELINGDDLTIPLLKTMNTENRVPLVIVDGLDLSGRHHPPFSSSNEVIIHYPGAVLDHRQLVELLKSIYPNEHLLSVLVAKVQEAQKWQHTSLAEVANISTPIEALNIPSLTTDSSLESFQEVIAHLRAPEDGCPWDKKQTHSSLRTYLLEETYEALDALDKNDPESLKEELGDILLQILLHAQIAMEAGEFNMGDIIGFINRKIVYRHPHVFKDWVVADENDVTQNWESLKGLEREKNGNETKKGMLDGVPNSFPALAQAQSIQDRAARVGFDWPEIAPVMDKVLEELEEVKSAPNEQERAKELGDLLFAIVNLIRWHKVDAESALRQTNLKFRKRFAYIEKQARSQGRDLQQMTLTEMDRFWEQAKAFDDQP